MRRALPWLLVLAACSADPPPAERESATSVGAEPPAAGVAGAEPTDSVEPADAVEPMGRCHVSCCSARVLELQAQSDDPSIQNECCFCDD